jgi:hypothetical protein
MIAIGGASYVFDVAMYGVGAGRVAEPVSDSDPLRWLVLPVILLLPGFFFFGLAIIGSLFASLIRLVVGYLKRDSFTPEKQQKLS